MPSQEMRSDGEEPRERRKGNWRTDTTRSDTRSNKNTDTESPSKKMKSGPSSDMARSPVRDSPDMAQSFDRMAKGFDEMKTMLKAALEEKREGPSLSSSRNQTLNGGEAPATPNDVIPMRPISSSEVLQQYDELLQYDEYQKTLLNRLKIMGGMTHRETVHTIMSAIIAPELATSLTWTGKGKQGNIKIGSMKLIQTVIDASRDSFNVKDIYTKNEINKWLEKCKQSKRLASRVNQTQ